MSTLTLRSPLALRPDVVATVMGEGAVLLDLRTKFFYSANKSAWAILSALECGADVATLSAACRQYSADSGAVDSFFQFLAGEDLLESASAADGQLSYAGEWVPPVLEKHKEPLQRVMMSAFDPSIPLAE